MRRCCCMDAILRNALVRAWFVPSDWGQQRKKGFSEQSTLEQSGEGGGMGQSDPVQQGGSAQGGAVGWDAKVAPRAATPPVVANLATVRAEYGRLENQVRTRRPAPRTEP